MNTRRTPSRSRRLPGALAILAAVLALLASCGGGEPAGTPAERLAQAADLLDQEQPDRAAALLEATLDEEESAEGYYLLGNARSQQERYDLASSAYERALELDPAYADAAANLAVACYMQGRVDEAEEATRRALALQPEDADLHYNLGVLLAAEQRYDEAEDAFLAARRLDETLPQVYLGLGVLYRDTGRPDEAIAALRRYLELSDDAQWRAEAESILSELGADSGS